MLHKRSNRKPQTVQQRELVLHDIRVGVTRVRVVPLVRTESRENEQHEADEKIGCHHVNPDMDGQRRQEGEEARVLARRLLEEDANAEVHEGLGEVDDLLARIADGQRGHRQVHFLKGQNGNMDLTGVFIFLFCSMPIDLCTCIVASSVQGSVVNCM